VRLRVVLQNVLLEFWQVQYSHSRSRNGPLRSPVSQVENGRTAPGLDTLENLVRASEVSLCQLYCSGESTSATPKLSWEKQ